MSTGGRHKLVPQVTLVPSKAGVVCHDTLMLLSIYLKGSITNKPFLLESSPEYPILTQIFLVRGQKWLRNRCFSMKNDSLGSFFGTALSFFATRPFLFGTGLSFFGIGPCFFGIEPFFFGTTPRFYGTRLLFFVYKISDN